MPTSAAACFMPTARRWTAFLVSTSNANDQFNPQISALPGGSFGGFVVTWDSTAGGGPDIKAQVFGGPPPVTLTPNPDTYNADKTGEIINGLGGNDVITGEMR